MLDDLDIRSLHQLYKQRGDNTASWTGNQIYSDSFAPNLGRLFEQRMPAVYNYAGPQGKDDWGSYINSWENPYMGLINNTDSNIKFMRFKELLRQRMMLENLYKEKKYGM